jgi:hypothetical protein
LAAVPDYNNLTVSADKGTEEACVIDFSSPLQGMGMAESRLNRVAQRVARDPTEAADPNTAVDTIDARNQFSANLDTLKVGDEMTRTTLNLLA